MKCQWMDLSVSKDWKVCSFEHFPSIIQLSHTASFPATFSGGLLARWKFFFFLFFCFNVQVVISWANSNMS